MNAMDIRRLVQVDATGFHVHQVNLATPGHSADSANALRYIAHAAVGEPLFVIRGRDALAVPALMAYMEECERHGLMGMSNQVLMHRDRFMAWQAENALTTKLPDPYTGSPTLAPGPPLTA